MTAIRETFEETGVLLGSYYQSSAPRLSDAEVERARKDIHSNKLKFSEFLTTNGLKSDVQSLLPFTQWITPPNVPR